jgi:hypothetical protein
MKNLIIISVFILAIINLNCGSSELAAGEQWKEKYGIKLGTGVLAGKIHMAGSGRGGKKIMCLTKGIGGKVETNETIKQNGNLLIKNISPGNYFMTVCDTVIINNKGNISRILFGGYSLFAGYNCRTFYIEIHPDTIHYIDETIPGGYLDEMPKLRIDDFSEPKPYLDSCEVKTEYKELNETNYLIYFHK